MIRIVVPYPAGGITDQLARAIAQPMREVLGQTVIVETSLEPAAPSVTDYVAKSPRTATRWCSATAARAPPPA